MKPAHKCSQGIISDSMGVAIMASLITVYHDLIIALRSHNILRQDIKNIIEHSFVSLEASPLYCQYLSIEELKKVVFRKIEEQGK